MRAGLSKRELLSRALDHSGLNRLLSRSGSWSGLLVLNYHRIGSSTGELFDHALWSATTADFARQVRWLASRFQLIGSDQIEAVLSGEIRQAVMLTFDDGYRDNYNAAFPILREYGAPATFFISTGFIDSPSVPWWDEICWMIRTTSRTEFLLPEEFGGLFQIDPVTDPDCTVATRTILRRYKSVPGHRSGAFLEAVAQAAGTGRCPTAAAARELWMTWDMIREMHSAGMSIGGHTHSHPVLSRLAPEEQDREIELCRSRLDAELGTARPIDAFSYPVGGPNAFNEVSRACLQRHGFRWGFSYYGGWQRPGRHDPYDLPRRSVEQEDTLPQFRSLTVFPQLFA